MDYSYPAFRLGMKHLYLKIYYETNDHTSFFSLIDAYKHYLKNDKSIPARICELHSNFLNLIGWLAKIKSSGELESLFVLKKEIKANNHLDFRHKLWLMKKVEDLK